MAQGCRHFFCSFRFSCLQIWQLEIKCVPLPNKRNYLNYVQTKTAILGMGMVSGAFS